MRIVDKCEPIKQKKAPKIVTNNIKECLNLEELDPIEELKLEIRNFLIKKGNKNDEVGKPWYIRPNLPAHIDPVYHTFGTTCRDPTTVNDVLTSECVNYIDVDTKFERIPGEQTTRNYKKPFDKNAKFGRKFEVDNWGSRAKKILYWYKGQPQVCDDEPKRFYSREAPLLPKDLDPNHEGVSKILKECPIDTEIFKRKLCIAHLNQLRRQIRKRDDQVDFFNIREHFLCLNRKNQDPCTSLVSLDLFYDVLKLVRIKPDRELFEYILNDLDMTTKDGKVYFEEALSLLNWRCKFPTLSKIQDLPKDCLYFDTMYNRSMLACEEIDDQVKMWCLRRPPVSFAETDPERESVCKTIKECPMESDAFKRKACFAHLNMVRMQIKKRGDQVNFYTLNERLNEITLDYSSRRLVTLDKFYDVLLATKINPNRELFEYILRDLDLITKNSEVLFEEALKVLDWRYEYPSLSFIKDLPNDCLHYDTTYNEFMTPHEAQPVPKTMKREDTICLKGYK